MRYKRLDNFLEEHFIPNNVLYRQIINPYNPDELEYEKYVNLHRISCLRLTDEEKNYIVDYLTKRGIIVRGRYDSLDFETDYDIDAKHYAGGDKPKALTKEEIDEKFKLYNETHDPKIRDEIIVGNMRLVWYVLSKMAFDYDLDQYDLLQTGYVGLVTAVDRYDISKGLAFSTYATKYIEGYIKDETHLQHGVRTTDIPMFRIMKNVEKEIGESITENPKIAEQVVDKIIDKGVRSEINRDENLRRVMMLNTVSLDEILENNEDEFIYNLGYEPLDNDMSHLYDEEAEKIIREEIDKLSDKNKKILAMRFGLDGNDPQVFTKIAKEVGMSAYGANLNVRTTCKELSEKPKVRALKDYLYKEI